MYDKIIESVNVKRTMSPNAWLWSLIADCKNQKDIELLFEALKSLRIFRLSNLRIHENFNCALCRDIAKACARVGDLEFGKKTLWLHNVYGLSPSVASANHLLTYAKKNKDAKLMEEVMKLMKPNDLSLQSSTADLVFRFLDDGKSLELLHKTQVEDVPLALCQYQGRLLAGVGSVLRLYDLGKRRLLRKCENKLFPNAIISINTYRDRIYVGDVQEGKLNGAPNKVEEILQYHVGDVVTCLQKASLIPGGGECIVYGTVMGSIGALHAFTSRDDVDFFSHLEMHLRQEHPPLCGRDHMAYRSAYFPVKRLLAKYGSQISVISIVSLFVYLLMSPV